MLLLRLANGGNYARLVRVRAQWPASGAPFLVEYSDNYFDLLPGEQKSLDWKCSCPQNTPQRLPEH